MEHVKILTSPSCSYCHAAKNLLQQQGIAYQEVDLIKDEEQAQQLLTQSRQRTIPQIFINEQSIGGFTEITELINDTEFDLAILSIN